MYAILHLDIIATMKDYIEDIPRDLIMEFSSNEKDLHCSQELKLVRANALWPPG